MCKCANQKIFFINGSFVAQPLSNLCRRSSGWARSSAWVCSTLRGPPSPASPTSSSSSSSKCHFRLFFSQFIFPKSGVPTLFTEPKLTKLKICRDMLDNPIWEFCATCNFAFNTTWPPTRYIICIIIYILPTTFNYIFIQNEMFRCKC